MATAPHPLFELTATRLKIFFREPSAVFWTFGFPLILTLALGIAFRNKGPQPSRVGLLDPAAAAAAAPPALLSKEFVVQPLAGTREAEQALSSGKVDVVVVAGAPRTYLFDPSRPESRLARLAVDDALQRAEGRRDPTGTAERVLTRPGSRYIDFLVPGLLGLNLLSSGLWGIGYLIVELRTRKLLKRMLATPMKRSHFLSSFVVMRTLFLLLELPVLLGFAHVFFDVTVQGSLLLFTGLSLFGALTFAAMGLLVAARAQNTQTVSGLINLVMLPMWMGSGVFFSTGRFPEVLQPVLKALPLTALNDALRAVSIDGKGVRGVLLELSILGAWGVVSAVLALRFFRWR